MRSRSTSLHPRSESYGRRQAGRCDQSGWQCQLGIPPIARGSTIVMFATGEGQTNPPGLDGQLATSPYPKPVLPVSVTVGGKPASLAYYGAAPGETAGLMQLNVVVPMDISPGTTAVVLKV